MFGVGLPVALQNKVWLLPSTTIVLDGAQTIALLSERQVVQEIKLNAIPLAYKYVYFATGQYTRFYSTGTLQ